MAMRTKGGINEKKKNKLFSHFGWIRKWREEIGFRERKSNFSLDFPAFVTSVIVGPRGKVALHCNGYPWAPVLRSFENFGR